MLTEYFEMLPVSLGPPQGWDTNTVRWGENFRQDNSKGWRWGENTKDMNQRNPAVSLPLPLLQTVFLYPSASYTEFTQLFSDHIYGEVFPQRIKYMSLRHSQGSVPCNSSCCRLVSFWRKAKVVEKSLMLGGVGGTTEDEMAGWHHQLDWHDFG